MPIYRNISVISLIFLQAGFFIISQIGNIVNRTASKLQTIRIGEAIHCLSLWAKMATKDSVSQAAMGL